MDAGDAHGLGYRRVDDDPNLAVLIDTMDATGAWDATRRLRRWERARLRLSGGHRLLDVGCGTGDAALALAPDLGVDGEVVGIDASAAMVAVARQRASTWRYEPEDGDGAITRSACCTLRFVVGDALRIDEEDESFDAVRSERTLQWLADPAVALAEMVRVARPGASISLIDTDWSTFDLDLGPGDPDQRVRRMVKEALSVESGRPSTIGGRLALLVEEAGLTVVGQTAETQRWSAWDPDATPAPDGCFSMASLADDLIDAGNLAATDREWFVSTVHDAARRGQLRMALTMFAVVGSVPLQGRRATHTDGAAGIAEVL